MRYRWLICVAGLIGSASIGAAEPLQTRGVVDAVTVYRGQALVTRAIDVAGPAGLLELVVTDLPDQIVPGSLYAEPGEAMSVRSVRFRTRPVAKDVREDVRKLDEQLREIADQLAAIAQRRQVLTDQNAYVAKLEGFVAPTATVELSKGVLNAETLSKLTTFIFEQRGRMAEEALKLGVQERELQERNQLLQADKATITGGSTRIAREAVVFMNVAEGKRGPLRLRYLVNGATWTPSYTARSDAQRKAVSMDYFASIQQMSGEDWGDVTMTLSTATPTMLSTAPVLAPLSVSLAALQQQQVQPALPLPQQAAGYKSGSKLDLFNEQRRVEAALASNTMVVAQAQAENAPDAVDRALVLMIDNNKKLTAELNDLACKVQMIEWTTPGRSASQPCEPRPPVTEGLSVIYQLAARTSLPSRADQQLIQIASMPMQGEFYRVAMPVLTNYVYEEASLVNTGNLVLLAGPVATYLDGQFVGHGSLPTVAAGERFTVGFGIDSALRASRELVDRTETVQAGNRMIEFTYRMTLENFAPAAAKVRVMDRMPAGNDTDLKIALVSTSIPTSTDPTYEKTLRKSGLLRWDIDIPAEKTALNAVTLEYKFKLEYDKAMTIMGMPMVMK